MSKRKTQTNQPTTTPRPTAKPNDQARLTDNAFAVLRCVADFAQNPAHRYPPTFQEIADAVGLNSKSHVSYILHQLIERGLVQADLPSPRTMEITKQGSAYLAQHQTAEDKINHD